MAATFACPHCGASYPVKPVLVGRAVRCTKCKNAFKLRADGIADKVEMEAPAFPPAAAVSAAAAPALAAKATAPTNAAPLISAPPPMKTAPAPAPAKSPPPAARAPTPEPSARSSASASLPAAADKPGTDRVERLKL